MPPPSKQTLTSCFSDLSNSHWGVTTQTATIHSSDKVWGDIRGWKVQQCFGLNLGVLHQIH